MRYKSYFSIQGTNADIIKYALILLYKELPKDSAVIACIHDEVVVEVPERYVEERADCVSHCLLTACRALLQTVHLPETLEVTVAEYWQKS